MASAPEASRAWLLIEHSGPWAAEPVESAGLPAAAIQAAELGVRVQLIKRPGSAGTAMYAAWTAGPAVWAGEFSGDVGALAAGSDAAICGPGEPMFLVCTHGRRNACCGRYGGALARALSAAGYPVWETTHVGGHRFAANLVILPHGVYYGPVDLPARWPRWMATGAGSSSPGACAGAPEWTRPRSGPNTRKSSSPVRWICRNWLLRCPDCG